MAVASRGHKNWLQFEQHYSHSVLISISSVKQFVGKCPDTYSNLISTPLDECQSWWVSTLRATRPSQSLRATIGPLQDNWSLFHYVIGILGILPCNRNVTLQTLELFSACARLCNAAASPAPRLRSAGSLAMTFPLKKNVCISAIYDSTFVNTNG